MAPVLRPRSESRLPNVVERPARRSTGRAAKKTTVKKTTEKRFSAKKSKSSQTFVVPEGDDDDEEEEGEEREEVITNCEYWPEICSHLSNRHFNGQKAPRLELTCAICQTSVLRFPSAIMSNRENKEVDDLTVTPCGHVFGTHCLQNWLVTKLYNMEEPGCPTCRFPLWHQGCKHYIGVRSFWSYDLAGLPSQVPVPVPQGGHVPPDCKYCRERHVQGAIMGAMRQVFDDSYLTRDGIHPELRETTRRYLSELTMRNVMNSYYTWVDSNHEADEWI